MRPKRVGSGFAVCRALPIESFPGSLYRFDQQPQRSQGWPARYRESVENNNHLHFLAVFSNLLIDEKYMRGG
jgi:hypothetical protein